MEERSCKNCVKWYISSPEEKFLKSVPIGKCVKNKDILTYEVESSLCDDWQGN